MLFNQGTPLAARPGFFLTRRDLKSLFARLAPAVEKKNKKKTKELWAVDEEILQIAASSRFCLPIMNEPAPFQPLFRGRPGGKVAANRRQSNFRR